MNEISLSLQSDIRLTNLSKFSNLIKIKFLILIDNTLSKRIK